MLKITEDIEVGFVQHSETGTIHVIMVSFGMVGGTNCDSALGQGATWVEIPMQLTDEQKAKRCPICFTVEQKGKTE